MNLGTQSTQTNDQEQAVLYSRVVVARSLQDSTHQCHTNALHLLPTQRNASFGCYVHSESRRVRQSLPYKDKMKEQYVHLKFSPNCKHEAKVELTACRIQHRTIIFVLV